MTATMAMPTLLVVGFIDSFDVLARYPTSHYLSHALPTTDRIFFRENRVPDCRAPHNVRLLHRLFSCLNLGTSPQNERPYAISIGSHAACL